MIYSITANPSVDYIIQTDSLKHGVVNRAKYDAKLPGGKGINVSRILQTLNIDNIALGFVGNITGQMFKELLVPHNLKTNFTEIKADNRINIKVKTKTDETEINGVGPKITNSEKECLIKLLTKNLQKDDVVIISGSLPPNLDFSFYLEIAKIAQEKEAEFVVDTTGQALLDTLPFNPLVIKPNHHELAELFNTELNSEQDIVKYARKLLHQGAKNVLVSMAGDGAILVTADKEYKITAPNGVVINSVGAGDSMIAGFVGTYMNTKDQTKSFKMGAACGSATAFSEDLATKEKIDEVYQMLKVIEI